RDWSSECALPIYINMKIPILLHYGFSLSITVRVLAVFVLFCCRWFEAIAGSVSEARSVYQQELTVAGRVTDSLNTPLAGVSIALKGDERVATSTDENGLYVLRVPNDQAVIVVSYVGFVTQEILVGGQAELDVVLERSDEEIDEVVVVAFGSQRKRELVGSMSTVNPSELRVPSSNLTTALAGRLAGLVAYQRSGEPGQDNAEFFIRGVTTFGYASSPLILIDGVEMRSEDLARLQVDDIASFSIMKDASATALYGARGANGVILVSTKEGKEGKAQVSVRYERSLSSATKDV